ncbi:MAG: hypothetical protein ABW034_06080 [Steroidobacteraceae bacterium]
MQQSARTHSGGDAEPLRLVRSILEPSTREEHSMRVLVLLGGEPPVLCAAGVRQTRKKAEKYANAPDTTSGFLGLQCNRFFAVAA